MSSILTPGVGYIWHEHQRRILLVDRILALNATLPLGLTPRQHSDDLASTYSEPLQLARAACIEMSAMIPFNSSVLLAAGPDCPISYATPVDLQQLSSRALTQSGQETGFTAMHLTEIGLHNREDIEWFDPSLIRARKVEQNRIERKRSTLEQVRKENTLGIVMTQDMERDVEEVYVRVREEDYVVGLEGEVDAVRDELGGIPGAMLESDGRWRAEEEELSEERAELEYAMMFAGGEKMCEEGDEMDIGQ